MLAGEPLRQDEPHEHAVGSGATHFPQVVLEEVLVDLAVLSAARGVDVVPSGVVAVDRAGVAVIHRAVKGVLVEASLVGDATGVFARVGGVADAALDVALRR